MKYDFFLKIIKISLLALFFHCHSATASSDSSSPFEKCVFYNPKNKLTYDLSRLVVTNFRGEGHDYIVNDDIEKNHFHYLLNVCHQIVSRNAKISALPGRPGIVQKPQNDAREDSFKSCGSVAAGDISYEFDDDMLVLFYANGSRCEHHDGYSNSSLFFVCNNQIKGPGNPKLALHNDCVYTFIWDSPYACPLSSTSQNLPIFSKICLSLTFFFVFYLAIGALYRHRFIGARGIHMLPHLEFWNWCFQQFVALLAAIRLFFPPTRNIVRYKGLDDESMENLISDEDEDCDQIGDHDSILGDLDDTYYPEFRDHAHSSHASLPPTSTAGSTLLHPNITLDPNLPSSDPQDHNRVQHKVDDDDDDDPLLFNQ